MLSGWHRMSREEALLGGVALTVSHCSRQHVKEAGIARLTGIGGNQQGIGHPHGKPEERQQAKP